ncbi:MAG: HlyD family efflux transporter periplasmic adaptor subunit [Lentisphaeria bacterium]|nr:HlyD family efflux transporter periplasmic adaptor subunit [Lentisphaeria bacterium]
MSKNAVKQGAVRHRLRLFLLLTLAGISAILVLLVSLFLFKIEDTIYCAGVIVPEHTFEIVGHIEAHIIKFHHRVGDDVKKGEIIAELDSRSYVSDAIALEASIRELEAELEVERAELEILKKEPLPKDLWYSATNLTESKQLADVTRERLERSKKLQLASAISKVEFEKIELEAIQREAALARAVENRRRVESGLGEKYIEKAKRDMELVAAKIKGKKAELEFIRQRIAECRIVSPADGRIVELPCKDTWYVARGKVVAAIASGKRVRAIARIDASVVRKVKPGQQVRVTSDVYNKYQYGNFNGVIKWIGDVPLHSDIGGPMIRYPAEVELDPEGYVLKYGSGVELAIITGRQPAIYALLNMSDEDFQEIRRKREAHRKAADGKSQLGSAVPENRQTAE